MGRIAASAVLVVLTIPFAVFAGTPPADDQITFQTARVTQVSDQHASDIPGTGTKGQIETLTAVVLDGADKGREVTFENDYIQLSVGDVFYLRHTLGAADGSDYWTVADPYRLPVLGIMFALFLALIFFFGGWQGVRGLAALAGSLVLIFFALVPGILHGFSPVLISAGVAGVIVVLGAYVTHGFSRTTTAAVLGMLGTLILTGLVGLWAVHAAHLSGYASEEAVSLNFQTYGGIDMEGLLFGGIIIGLLGILYDIAIGQAVAVEELMNAGAHLTGREVYQRALRIGREHIGALVNTLAIAYVGASLPLFLLVVSGATASVGFIVNNEIFATEIIRILTGSIGLVLAVPATTVIAVTLLKRRGAKEQ